MRTKREIDVHFGRLVAVHAAAVQRYHRAWGTSDLIPAAREMDETLTRLKTFAEEHAPSYNSLPNE